MTRKENKKRNRRMPISLENLAPIHEVRGSGDKRIFGILSPDVKSTGKKKRK